MKRNPTLAILLLTALLLVVACTGSGEKKGATQSRERMEGEAEENPMVTQLEEHSQAAMLVTLVGQEGDSLVMKDSESGQELTLAFIEAHETGEFKGSVTNDCQYSIYVDMQSKTILAAINLTELGGQWFYDMKQHRGLEFDQRGTISSINVDDISFREWKLLSGKFYIYYLLPEMVAPEHNEFLVEQADIVALSKTQLTFCFRGKTYDCHRQQKVLKMKL